MYLYDNVGVCVCVVMFGLFLLLYLPLSATCWESCCEGRREGMRDGRGEDTFCLIQIPFARREKEEMTALFFCNDTKSIVCAFLQLIFMRLRFM